MKTPQEIIEERKKVFIELFPRAITQTYLPEEVFEWLEVSFKSLLQSDIEGLEGMKKKHYSIDSVNSDPYIKKLDREIPPYNQALSDIIQKKQQQLKELSN